MNEETPPLATPMPYDAQTDEILPSKDAMVQGGGQQTALGGQAIKVLMSTPIVAPRDYGKLRRDLTALCAEHAERYIYSWTVKDRKNNRESTIEGLTIKGAMDLWRAYGNCFAGPLDVEDRGQHWLFTAVFFDRETGSITMRQFLQRKGQKTGMRDQERAADIIFQIGQSKAIRNVIVNALAGEVGFMLDLCRRGLAQWVEENRGKADEYIDRMIEEHAIDQIRMEALIGKPRGKWTIRELARMMAELRGVEEGFQNAETAFPPIEAAGELMAEKQAARTEETAAPKGDKKRDTKKGKPVATPEESSTPAGQTADTKGLTGPSEQAHGGKKPRGRPRGSTKKKAAPEEKPAEPTQEPAGKAPAEETPHDPETGEVTEPLSDAQEPPSEEGPQGSLDGDDWGEFE